MNANNSPSSSATFASRLAWLQTDGYMHLTGILHGIEREALRVTPSGKLSEQSHPSALGAALTHAHITTDYSESLLEFITPPTSDISETLQQLHDIHTFTLQNIGDEQLWPMSMPCFVGTEDDIQLAFYGKSNIGKMKHLYRQGLKHRYGSMMQAISGVHFNFSLPTSFWQAYLPHTSSPEIEVSSHYFGLIRNYRRMCWLIPYLFGASPALCKSFLQGRDTGLDFTDSGRGTVYLPYATSLRMSDLGYTNSAQSSLAISYNSLDEYVSTVRNAIRTHSDEYAQFATGENGVYQQLNSNILQIENELYSPIRPKQPTLSGEKPSDALENRGVEYIEVRALDVNPFASIGIDESCIRFLDVFLIYCLLRPSSDLSQDEYAVTESNIKYVVLNGRHPSCELNQDGQTVTLKTWANDIMQDLQLIAACLDKAHNTQSYTQAVALQSDKVNDPGLTPSGKITQYLQSHNEDNSIYGKMLAEQHRHTLLTRQFSVYDETYFAKLTHSSFAEQQEIEASDTLGFDAFLKAYFDY